MRRNWSKNFVIAAACSAATAPAAIGNWVEFEDETEDRLVAAPSIGINDNEERHYAWGDVNQDGWLDLAVARKTPQTSTGKRRNVLLMNEQGVLVDRTEEYASAAVVDGHTDNGFLTETNDRRVIMVDANGNGWLDMITATTLSFGSPKHIAYPRVYVNQGEDGAGDWQGFVFEDERIAQFEGDATNGMPHAPRFCGLAAGDVTGDGLPDLYFADYNSGSDGGNFDFNDRLLVNQGNGYFDDESHRIPSSWLVSTFGSSAQIADLNGDGVNDIVRSNSLGGYDVDIFYNDPDNEGQFVSHQSPSGAPYFVNAADLNNNGRLDLVVVTDGTDVIHWNQGNQSDGQVDWLSFALPNSTGVDGNKVTFADLNNNGWTDILVAGNDPDFGGCRNAFIYRNNQDETFSQDYGNVSPSDMNGAYHIAAFDINANGWIDIVIGKCGGTQVLINQPQAGIDITVPEHPAMLEPDTPTDIVVEFDAFPTEESIASATLYYSIDGSDFQSTPMSPVGGDNYVGTLPGIDCASTVEYYFEAQLEGSGIIATEPLNAPIDTFSATAASGTEVTFTDDISGDVSGWDIESDPSLQSGAWEQATPNPVLYAFPATLAQPDGANVGTMAFITENCPDDSDLMGCSVSLGPTHLISPVFDLEGFDAIISYDRWFFCNHEGVANREDVLVTEVSNDGGQTWVHVHETTGTNQEWESMEFAVAQFVEPTSDVRVRFTVEDDDNSSVTNAAIDNLSIEEFTCFEPKVCPGDLTGSGGVDVDDLLIVLNNWGSCADSQPGCSGDANDDAEVNVDDLLIVLNNWGPCAQ